jgi:hypothetical protein
MASFYGYEMSSLAFSMASTCGEKLSENIHADGLQCGVSLYLAVISLNGYCESDRYQSISNRI